MNKFLLLIFLTALISGTIKVYGQASSDFQKTADSLLEARNYQLAMDNYSKAIDLSKKDHKKLSELYARRGQCKQELQLHNDAIVDETLAIKYDAQNADAYWKRAMYFESLMAYQPASNDYTTAMTFYTSDHINLSILYDNRAFIKYKQLKFIDALADDSVALTLNTKNESAYWHKGQVYSGLSMYQASIDSYKRALLYEDDKKEIAKLFDNIANDERSLAQYSKAIDDENTAISLMPDKGPYYWNRGVAYQGNKDYQLAIEDFNTAMPYYQNSGKQLSALYSDRALNELFLRDYHKAIADDSVAIALNPQSGFAYWMMGSAYSGLGAYQPALDKYKTAMTFYADNNKIMCSLYSDCASNEYRFKDDKASLTHCMQAIALNPQSIAPYYTRGKLYLKRLQNTEAAMKDFKKVLELDTTKKSANYIFALYYSGETENALQLMKSKILKTTNSSDVLSDYYNMACLLSLMKQQTEANTYLKVAVDKGYPAKFAVADDDLDNIKNTPEFKSLITEYVK